MPSHIPFYLKQSFLSLKKEWVIIICVSISLSMVAGLSYYNEATQQYQFDSSLTSLSDIEIVHYQFISDRTGITPRLDYTDNFLESDDVIQEALNKSTLDLIGAYKYGLLTCERGFFVRSDFESVDSASSITVIDYKKVLNASEIKFMVSEDSFYNSTRFEENFKIIEGKSPSKPEHILIDYNFARKYSLQVNETANITLLIGNTLNIKKFVIKDFQFQNVTISGIYLPTKLDFFLDLERFEYSYTYQDYLQNLPYKENPERLDGPAIFSWYNFTGPDGFHPFQKLYYEIDSDDEFDRYIKQGSYTRSGYLLTYNRTNIDYKHLSQYKTMISNKAKELTRDMPWDVSLVNKIGYQLTEMQLTFQKTRYLIQILNFPVIIFSIFISKTFTKKFEDQRNNLLITMRRRGIPLKIIQKQQIFKLSLYSFLSFINGAILGFLTFFVYQKLVGDMFYSEDRVLLMPIITSFSFIFTFAVSIILMSSINSKSIKKIRKLTFNEITEMSHISEDQPNFDELLFVTKRIKKNKEEKYLLQENLKLNLKETESNSKKKTKNNHKRNKKNKTTFSEERGEKRIKITKITYFLICVGLLPLILNFLIYLGNLYTLSDVLEDLFISLMDSIDIINISVLIGLGCLIIGLTRILFIERPGFLVRMANIFSRIFSKRYHEIIALRIPTRKKWIGIMNMLIMFSSFILLSNIVYNSEYRHDILIENAYIGADIRVNLERTTLKNQSDIDNFEKSLLNLTTSNGSKIFSDIISCSIDDEAIIEYNLSNSIKTLKIPIYSFNWSHYLKILQDGGKPLPNPSFDLDIRRALNHNADETISSKMIFVSQYFLDYTMLEIGSTFIIDHEYYDSQESTYKTESIQVEIFNIMDFMPGISPNSYENIIFIDNNCFNLSKSLLHGDSMINLISLEQYQEIDYGTIVNSVRTSYLSISSSIAYNFFDQSWDDIEEAEFSLEFGESGFYKLLYLDFLILGIFIILQISLMENHLYKETSKENQTLIMMGIKKSKLPEIFLVEFLFVFLFSLLLGGLLGLGYASSLIRTNNAINYGNNFLILPPNLKFPLYFEYIPLLAIFAAIIIIPFMIFVVINHINENKKKKNLFNLNKNYINHKKT